MVICGIKVSHDGGVAVIDGNRLMFSIEVEKLKNNYRYSSLGELDRVSEMLRAEQIEPSDIDQFVVDGWYPPVGEASSAILTSLHGTPLRLYVGPYTGSGAFRDPLHRHNFGGVKDSVLRAGYSSYAHASSHAIGAYCSSPFACRCEDSLVLVWDGGILPWLYDVRSAKSVVKRLHPILPIRGDLFGLFCGQLEPFVRDMSSMTAEDRTRSCLEVPGKAMAYAALGKIEPSLFPAFDELVRRFIPLAAAKAADLRRGLAQTALELFPGVSSADLIATFQSFLGQSLADSLRRVLHNRYRGQCPNLCLAGGCALNIKWNALLRASGMFKEIWVPPFPNDSGAAIGTACCEMLRQCGTLALQWDVYSGPLLGPNRCPDGWSSRPFDEKQLAELLHIEGEPIVVLYGRAEIGPRALGNRSILAPATNIEMKRKLNAIKGRASYRPVAPICLASRATEVFSPGLEDPYMVFENRVRSEWINLIPAVVHLDGSARLQTVSASQSNTVVGRILSEYESLTGIPVLCNTSANFAGRGFFADVQDAAEWGVARYVWASGALYTNPRRPSQI